ncbi:MAG: transporter [Candidatus Saganbacteria bacterium]|nr:transporter [Candidatus Saganbacteria bacterium]
MILFSVIFLIFIIFAVLMYLNKVPALIALPVMAVLIAFVSGLSPADVSTKVIADGATRLSTPIIVIIFGSMLSQFVSRSGIAETLIKKVAELSGDNPFLVSIVLTAVVAVLFSVLGGLGSVIMVATIVLPIMLSIGLPRIVTGCVFLIGMSLGGIFNLINWQLYISVLGLSQDQIFRFAIPLGLCFSVVTVLFLFIEIKRHGTSIGWTEKTEEERPKFVSWYAALTPVIPLVLVLGFSVYNILAKPANPYEFPIITAMVIGLLYGFLTTLRKDSVNLLSRSIYEGINSVGPAVALIIGIGMLLNAVMNPNVTSSLSPVLVKILPSSPLYYVLFFAVLSPLTLYRGPLNIWGMGAGLIGLMVTSNVMPPVAIMAALMSVGQIQGVCDPTNTQNVWIANYLNINVQDILKRTILYIWILAVAGLAIAAFRYF